MLFVGDLLMIEVVAIVEGQTEQTFVRNQLAKHLIYHGITIWPVLPGKSRNQWGVRKWDAASQDIIRTLKEGRYCTTMFDYYGMPNSWPGRSDANVLPWRDRARHVEEEILREITERMGSSFNPAQFVPYVQLHEFEALTFADVTNLSEVSRPLTSYSVEFLKQHFNSILNDAGDPEAINDNFDTCPSRRIVAVVKPYRKPLQGPIITARTGLPVLREKCSHFAAWLTKLEALGTGTS